MDEREASHDTLAKKIAGDIVLSENPGAAIERWRNIFKVTRRALAEKMKVTPSLISDYESGRRKSPGVAVIRRFVDALISVDEDTGSVVSRGFNDVRIGDVLNDSIIDVRKLENPRTIKEIMSIVKGIAFADGEDTRKNIYGYVIVDSIKAITEISPTEFAKFYDLITDRAIVFTSMAHGISPLVAIKVANLHPGVVVFHGPKELDPLAERIARVERIPVVISNASSVDELVAGLKSL